LYISVVDKILLGIFGIFSRVQELHNNPLLVKGFSGTELDEFIDNLRNRKFPSHSLQYVGPEQDILNRHKDKENLARDFNKAFQAAKVRLGV